MRRAFGKPRAGEGNGPQSMELMKRAISSLISLYVFLLVPVISYPNPTPE
jgi:hypothetical protein